MASKYFLIQGWMYAPIIGLYLEYKIDSKILYSNYIQKGTIYLGGELFSVSFVISLDDRTAGRLRYSNSEVTDTVDFVFKLILERGDTSVTLIGILRFIFFVQFLSETASISLVITD